MPVAAGGTHGGQNGIGYLCIGLFSFAHGPDLVSVQFDELEEQKVKRLVFCSGKVYYDLLEKRREQAIEHVAIIRIERLYPFPESQMRDLVDRYPNATEFVWCQEEPMNQGAWFSSQHHMRSALRQPELLRYAGRPFSAAPAAGYAWLHLKQQHALVAQALGLESAKEAR